MRIISLIASATEIVCALGLRRHLVGRSHECDYPPDIQNLPICTQPKFDVHGTSAEIDQRVKDTLAQAASVYDVRVDELRRLRPDFIITQAQCEVCAVSLKDVEQALCQWLEGRPQIISLNPNSLADVWDDIRRVADHLGIGANGERLVAQLQERMHQIERRTANLQERPTVCCLEWIEPMMAAGNWMPQLVQIAGGTDEIGKPNQHAPWLDWQTLQAKDPDVIIVLPCGFDLMRPQQEMPALIKHPQWRKLKAVRNRQVFVTDGNQYFNRPGPRLVESVEILAEILHPAEFPPRHKGKGWLRYSE